MISYLEGTVKDTLDSITIIEVNGVGYGVKIAGMQALEGQEVRVYVYTHVRENEISLFGFQNKEDLYVFEKLLGVSGVGPKSALAIIDVHGADGVAKHINSNNPQGLKVSGVGQKTAEKIIIELKSKLKDIKFSNISSANNKIENNLVDDAKEALVALGYREAEIEKAFSTFEMREEYTSAEIIREILKLLK